MGLLDANEYGDFAYRIYNTKKLTPAKKAGIKGTFLKEMSEFLSVYGEQECGCTDIDYLKLALWVNSPDYENSDLYTCRTPYKIRKQIVSKALNGFPLWRFLKLSDHQMDLLEKEYDRTKKEHASQLLSQYPCFSCIWFDALSTGFGTVYDCDLVKVTKHWRSRVRTQSLSEHTLKRGCKEHRTISEVTPDYMASIDERMTGDVNSGVSRSEKFLNHLAKGSGYCVPAHLPELADITLKDEREHEEIIISELAMALGSVRTEIERRKEYRTALYIAHMQDLYEIFAQTEMGNDYHADISRIAKWVWKHEATLPKCESIEEIDETITDWMIDGSPAYSNFITYQPKY